MTARSYTTLALATALLVGCDADTDRADSPPAPAEERAQEEAAPLWHDRQEGDASVDTARYDPDWRAAPTVDSAWAGAALDSPVLPVDSGEIRRPDLPDSLFDIPETLDDIGVDTVWADSTAGVRHLPLGGRVEGPSVLAAQVLLDRAGFSPGVIDGRWGGNVERAVFWFQRREGLRPTGRVDSVTLRTLQARATPMEPVVGIRTLVADDVEGPFTDVPDDVYERAELECLCPASPLEQIAERAHTTPDVLQRLNPDTDWDAIAAGDTIRVPLAGHFSRAANPAEAAGQDPAATDAMRPDSVAAGSPSQGRVDRIVVSDRGRYVHAFDAQGRLLYHFPATLGSDYNPSPDGRYEVTSVTFDPWFHYQPALLEGADPDDPSTRLPPGPNSPVGTVWIALSKEHYGIHGTNAPATIGYVTSSGCVRLTNWDATTLARHVSPGTVVEFRDIRERAEAADSTR